MRNRAIPFSPPDITELEINEAADALRSGWITTGIRVKKLENEIAEWIGTKKSNCVCLNSQTACAELTLRILGIGPQDGGTAEDEVITCAYTYTATASVIEHVGARIVLVDCSMKNGTIEMDYDALEEKINEHTKAIIPVDLGGIPCDYNKIFEIVENKKALFTPENKIQCALGRVAVIADAAHAFGASRNGKMVGNIADFTNFSFHAVKNFTTAEGGAVLWRSIDGIQDEEIYHSYQLLSLHGQSKDAFEKMCIGSWEYDIVDTGYKCNMTDIMAGIGLAQMKRYPDMLIRRKEIITKYDEAFKPLKIEVLNPYTNEYQSSGHLYITRVPGISCEQRQEIIIKMAEAGIACNVHYKPLPMMTAYIKRGFDIKDFPNAFEKFKNEITLPLHTKLTDEDVEYVVNQFCEIVNSYR